MSVSAGVNERLAALTAAGHERLARPDPPQPDRRRGELERLVARGLAARRHLQPGDLREGDPRLAPTTTTSSRELARAGPRRRARSTSEIAIHDVQLACDVLRPVWDEHGRRRRLRVARGRAAAGARHRGHARAGARLLGARRPPQPDDQDPGHRGGRAGDRAGDLRGHQRQRDAAVLGRVVRRSRRGVHPRDGAPPRGRASRSTCTRWRASSSRAWTPRWTSASRQLGQQRPRRARPRSPTRAPPTCASRRSSTASASPRCATPGPRSSARCGPRPASKNPRYPDTMYVDELVAPDTVNTMPMPTLLAVRRAAARSRAPPPTHDPPRTSSALAELATPASTCAT